MNIGGLEVNSPEYWELRHQREAWPRTSAWALSIISEVMRDRADVLEAGCGQGAMAAKLLQHRPDIMSLTAFDISPTAIDKAKELSSAIDYRVADVFNLKEEMKGKAFDYIITVQNFEHWKTEDHTAAFRNLWSRLRPGGKLFFTGVGMDWNISQMNYGPIQYNGATIQVPNDYHYNIWSEQDVYDLFMTQSASSVRFWRRRGRDRVIAEAEKARD